jgi:hypothetical protein
VCIGSPPPPPDPIPPPPAPPPPGPGPGRLLKPKETKDEQKRAARLGTSQLRVQLPTVNVPSGGQ